MTTPSSPSVTSRLLALIVGPAYLLFVAQGLSVGTQTSLVVTLPLTIAGSLVIMTVLLVFGVRAYRYKHSVWRFTLSTAFLAAIPLSIYLAALRWVVQGIPQQNLDAIAWVLVSVVAILGMFFTTVVLLSLAEAIVWFAVALRGWLMARHREG